MESSIIQYVVFLIVFVLSLWACSAIQFDKFCKVNQPGKVILLLFLIALIMAKIASDAIFQLTMFNGFGG